MGSNKKTVRKTRKALKPKQPVLHYMKNTLPKKRNIVLHHVAGLHETITKQDIEFFESVPVVEVGMSIPGGNPYECGAHLFDHVGIRFPIEQYEKYIGSVPSYSHEYSYEEKTKKTIPPGVLDSVIGLLKVRGEYPQTTSDMKCLRILTNVSGKNVESVCAVSKTTTFIEYVVLGTRQHAGIYSFSEFPLKDWERPYNPIELVLWHKDIHIRKINKSNIVGFETGTTAVHIALSWASLFNPRNAFDVTLEDQATIPCGKTSSIRLSLLQFLTRPVPRLSWYNSFGFQSKLNVNTDLVKDYQEKIQAVPISTIADYLQGLLDTPASDDVWYLKSDLASVSLLPSTEALELTELPEEMMTSAIKAMAGQPMTVKDFFSKKDNCSYLRVMPYESSIPIAYVDARGATAKTYAFPCAHEFLYLEPRLGGDRVKHPM